MMQPVGLTRPADERAFPGYTLFTPLGGSTVFLIDMEGRIAHTWHTPERVAYAFMLPGGRLLARCNSRRAPRRPFLGTGDSIFELDWDGGTRWEYHNPDLHHDLARLRNGNTLFVTYEAMDAALSARVKGGPLPDGATMIADGLLEVTPAGETAWRWNGAEALDPALDRQCPVEQVAELHEWTHANACAELDDGNIVISFRHTDTIAGIERGTGRVLWRWGPGEVKHQHSPTPLASGNLLLFDNGTHRRGVDRSRIVEMNPASGAVVWTYSADPDGAFYSAAISSAQRLPNGNTLVCEGCNGRLFEVTAEGEVVWEYVIPLFYRMAGQRTNWSFRAHRYAAESAELAGQRPTRRASPRSTRTSHRYAPGPTRSGRCRCLNRPEMMPAFGGMPPRTEDTPSIEPDINEEQRG